MALIELLKHTASDAEVENPGSGDLDMYGWAVGMYQSTAIVGAVDKHAAAGAVYILENVASVSPTVTKLVLFPVSLFSDDFEDGVKSLSEDVPVGTIAEAVGKLTVAVGAGVNAEWPTAPIAYKAQGESSENKGVRFETRISSISAVGSDAGGGIAAYYTRNEAWFFAVRCNGASYNLEAYRRLGGVTTTAGLSILISDPNVAPVELRLYWSSYTGMCEMWYRQGGDWTLAKRYNPMGGLYEPDKVGLFAFNWNTHPAISVSYDYLTADSMVEHGEFGTSVAIDGDWAIVGAPTRDPYGTAGRAYVLKKTGGVWAIHQTLQSDDANSVSFGYDVDIKVVGSTVIAVVSDYEDRQIATRSGAVFCFKAPVATGIFAKTAKFKASDAGLNKYFGCAVSLDSTGTLCAVGAYAGGAVVNSGACYVFSEDIAPTWTQKQKLVASDSKALDYFGCDVSLSLNGGILLVGADYYIHGSLGGRAYLFTLTSGTWSQTANLVPNDSAHADMFGSSVRYCPDVDTAVIGCLFPGGGAAGAIYTFVGPSWVQDQKILASDSADYDYFGKSLGLGDYLIVGSECDLPGGKIGAGGVYIFDGAAIPLVVAGPPLRAPMGGLFVDDVRDTQDDSDIAVLNTVPENDETGVPIDDTIRLHVVSLKAVALNPTVKVYITRGSEGIRRLAYDQADGGFKSPYNGPLSVATYQASPGSGVNDELILVIDKTGLYTSLEPVLVEVEATAGT